MAAVLLNACTTTKHVRAAQAASGQDGAMFTGTAQRRAVCVLPSSSDCRTCISWTTTMPTCLAVPTAAWGQQPQCLAGCLPGSDSCNGPRQEGVMGPALPGFHMTSGHLQTAYEHIACQHTTSRTVCSVI
jgi:hypothetical protein